MPKSAKLSLHHPSRKSIPHNLKLEQWQRRSLYAVFVLLFASGAAWLLGHYFLRTPEEFSGSMHPIEPWAMKLHGALAMLTLFFIGSLLNTHIRRALKSQRNLISGWSLIVLITILTTSGYGLYYLATEENRTIWSSLHWILGLVFPILLCCHIVLGRRSAS